MLGVTFGTVLFPTRTDVQTLAMKTLLRRTSAAHYQVQLLHRTLTGTGTDALRFPPRADGKAFVCCHKQLLSVVKKRPYTHHHYIDRYNNKTCWGFLYIHFLDFISWRVVFRQKSR